MTASVKSDIGQKLQYLPKKELQRRDVFGRTILHLVCIVGRYDLLKRLLKNPNLNISVTDYESGWNGLHCSIFYGKLSCARLLLDHKYDLIKAKDRSGLTAMDLYYSKYSYQDLKIFPTSIGENDTNYTQRFETPGDFTLDDNNTYWWDKDQRGGSDVYTFGSNVNNQLGTGDSADKTTIPYRVKIMNYRLDDNSLKIADRLAKPRLKTIQLSKNHSIILTNEHFSNILISGNPNKGRLGTDSLSNNFRFNHMEFFKYDHIMDVAVCDDHSLALNASGEVYAWGLNNYYQLGFATEKIKGKVDTYSTEPRRVLGVLKKSRVQGISCSKTHSAAYFDNTLVLWGLNIGQMNFVSTGEQVKHGKFKGIVQIPRDMQFQHKIRQVIATEDSTIVLLDNNECHILHNRAHLKYQLPIFKALNDDFEHFRPSIFSKKKKIVKLVSKDRSAIAILYNDGSVLNFGIDLAGKSSNVKYSKVWTPRYSHMKCIDVDIGNDGSVIICVKSGCVFKRISKSTKTNDYKFTKIERLSKIVKVSCDSMFTSFGFIRDDVDLLPLQLAKNTFYQDIAYLSPLSQSIESKKQNELVGLDDSNLYTLDFLQRPNVEKEDEDFEMFADNYLESESKEIKDPLLKSYKERWLHSAKTKSTFLPLAKYDLEELIQSDSLVQYSCGYESDKGYDLMFCVDNYQIGVHSSFLFSLKKFQQLKESSLSIHGMIFGKVDSDSKIKVEGVNVYSLLIILHFLYTGVLLKPWENYSKNEIPLKIKDTKFQCSKLLESLKIKNGLETFYGASKVHDPDFSNFENDLTIHLKNDEIIECSSLILRSRSAYFETLFSDRWGDKDIDVLEFKHIDKVVFEIVLDYIYGKEQLSLWDKHTDLKSITEFINLQFDLIELSDELLLFGLKNFAQLFIKDFISQDNCLIILHHADNLNCQKLIGECLWFIYNNVDTLLADPDYDELLSDTMITRIDKYCRWLNRINKFSIHETRTAWLDGDSDDLLKKFLKDDLEFNDIFLGADNFVPVFDIQQDVTKPAKSQESKSTRLPTPPPRAASMERRASSSSFSSQRRPSVKIDSSSAIDLSEDEFQPVVNSRRRRSSANKRRLSSNSASSPQPNSIPFKLSANTPSKSVPIPIPNKSTPASRKSSLFSVNNGTPRSFDENYSPSINERSRVSSLSNSVSSNNWPSLNEANKGVGSSTMLNTPVPMKPSPSAQLSPNLVPSGVNVNYKLTSRNNSNVKLSQKERKKLMKQELSKTLDDSQTTPEVPWKIPEPAAVKPLSIIEAQTEVLLVKQGVINPGKFRDYQLNPQAVAVENKSLAEIQQEQEFEIWWKKESERVQDEMNSWNNFGSNKSSSTPRSKTRQNGRSHHNGSNGTPKNKNNDGIKSLNQSSKMRSQ